MHNYEIRILRNNGSTSLAVRHRHLDDNAAIRSARKLAQGARFEVWRGLHCVYGIEAVHSETAISPTDAARP